MNREYLQSQGFEGFETMGEIMDGLRTLIPAQKDIYVVLRESGSIPHFLSKETGGFFKRKNPNVSIVELKANWVEGSYVVYIGKACGAGSSASFRKRLDQYLHFGQGTSVGHWVGCYIWQLADSRDLVICWKNLPFDDPRTVERQTLADFKAVHAGTRPFANLIY